MTRRSQRKHDYLFNSHNQDILAILEGAAQPLHVSELAERLVKRDETVISSGEYEQRLERELISLHHNSLPRLAEFGLIDYHQETNTISSRSDAMAEVDWFDEDMVEQLLARFQTDRQSNENAIGVLEGRQTVIECGRQLADEAEKELFCMYVSTELLEEECLRHAEDAIDRGVEMYMGSRNPDVRDLTRKHLSEATIWEPQRARVNAPSEWPKVGRLVVIDRRKAMLAVLDEPDSDGNYPRETAMIGKGETNPLVVLVRELLGPRLDHLDYQSADFQSGLRSQQ